MVAGFTVAPSSAEIRKPALLSSQQSLNFGHGLMRKGSARASLVGAGDRTTLREHIFADGKAYSGLLLVAHQRKVRVEDVLRLLESTGGGMADHVSHHLGKGEAGHRTVSPPLHFLREKQTAVSAKNREATPPFGLGRANVGDLTQSRPILVFEHDDAR